MIASNFLSSSLDSLVKDLSKDKFKHLSREFDSDILVLVKQRISSLTEYE